VTARRTPRRTVALDASPLVFAAGLITALATGIGALPFFFFNTIGDRGNVAWGFASGSTLSASLFGLVREGLTEGTPVEIGIGTLAGAVVYLVLSEFVPEALETGEDLPRGGKPILVDGFTLGVALMIPLAYL